MRLIWLFTAELCSQSTSSFSWPSRSARSRSLVATSCGSSESGSASSVTAAAGRLARRAPRAGVVPPGSSGSACGSAADTNHPWSSRAGQTVACPVGGTLTQSRHGQVALSRRHRKRQVWGSVPVVRQAGKAALEVGGEVVPVSALQFWALPVPAADRATARGCPALAVHRPVVVVEERVVGGQLLAGADVAHGDQHNVAGEAHVGLA